MSAEPSRNEMPQHFAPYLSFVFFYVYNLWRFTERIYCIVVQILMYVFKTLMNLGLIIFCSLVFNKMATFRAGNRSSKVMLIITQVNHQVTHVLTAC